MRRLGPVLCLLLAAAVGGCGGSSDSADAPSGSAPSSAPTTEPAAAGASATPAGGLPEGDYLTEPLTVPDLVAAATAAGYPEAKARALAEESYGGGSVVFELLITADAFVQREIVDGGTPVDGFDASYVVADANTFVTTDQCGETTFDFASSGDELTLDLTDSVITGCDLPDDDIIVGTMVFESGVFTREEESGEETGASDASQTVDAFVRPFSIELADWLDPTSVDAAGQFVTWQSEDELRALRVLSPVSVYLPGGSTESPPPDDFPAYVLSLADAGASITDRVDTEVDGHPAVEMTVGLEPGTDSLDGTLGCPEAGTAAEDCFGPQDDLVLRLVAVEVDGTPILVWERDYADQGGSVDYAPFDAMVSSLDFS